MKSDNYPIYYLQSPDGKILSNIGGDEGFARPNEGYGLMITWMPNQEARDILWRVWKRALGGIEVKTNVNELMEKGGVFAEAAKYYQFISKNA